MRFCRILTCIMLTAALIAGCAREVDPSPEENVPEISGRIIPSGEMLLARRIPNLGMSEGDAGRFSVNGYTARLYTSGSNHVQSQQIVNDADSAWYYGNLTGLSAIIADHYYQGFETIKEAIPGETLAYLSKDGVVTAYRCVSVYRDGENLNGQLTLSDGRVLQTEKGDAPLATYTCNDDIGISITVVFWEPILTTKLPHSSYSGAE